MGEKRPTDLGAERLRRREPTDLGGIALACCLHEALEARRITPEEARERLEAYTTAYAGQYRPEPPDIVA